jgi:drug/metabolite transporter (DMT)-like permease
MADQEDQERSMNDEMSDSTALWIVAAVVIGVFAIIYFLDRRTKKKGSLITAKPTFGSRILAVLIGLVFTGAFAVAYFMADTVYPTFIVLGVALFAYGFGADAILAFLRQINHENLPPPMPPTEPVIESLDQPRKMHKMPYFFFWLIIAVVVVAGTFWVAAHPGSAASNVVVVIIVAGIFVVPLLAKIVDIIKIAKVKQH